MDMINCSSERVANPTSNGHTHTPVFLSCVGRPIGWMELVTKSLKVAHPTSNGQTDAPRFRPAVSRTLVMRLDLACLSHIGERTNLKPVVGIGRVLDSFDSVSGVFDSVSGVFDSVSGVTRTH